MSEPTVQVHPVRRHYNEWVNDETLEDYALRFTATRSRRWTCLQVANTALGSSSFLALEAIGAWVTLQYGFVNASLAITVVSVLIFLVALPIAVHAARAGVDIDLLTRGAGFGYLGSTITSLIYASFTFIFFAIEAAIMASALELWFGLPLSLCYVICSVVVIPVVIYGITRINQLQRMTQLPWLVLQLLPFGFLAWQGIAPLDDWQGFTGQAQRSGEGFDLVLFGSACAIVFSLMAQIGEQVDFLRFLPVKTPANRGQWWLALVSTGPGWIVVGAAKMFAGSFLMVFALQAGRSAAEASEPVHMYLAAFEQFANPDIALAMTGIFVIICQFKINVTNSYAGSIAWSNFFSRITHSHPGRVVWLFFNVGIALLLMELGVYKALENTLSLYSLVAVAWIGALAADLAINKPLGISPPHIEFRRAYLYDINPVGVGAMVLACAAAMLAYAGFWGETAQALSGFIALALAVTLVPALGLLTRGRYYLTRKNRLPTGAAVLTCCLCNHEFEQEDMADCPAYGGVVCSLCCSVDVSCENACRRQARVSAQIESVFRALLPARLFTQVNRPFFHYFGVLLLVACLLYLVVALVYVEASQRHAGSLEALVRLSTHLYAVLLVIAAVVTWVFLLIRQSRRAARLETQEQNRLLSLEIAAHRDTEAQLHKAKEAAEAANQAKSRYLMGLSHELRSPLNSIVGYAHLMRTDERMPAHRQAAVQVIQDSADHLTSLIESLLDISRIETGRLTIHRTRLPLHQFLERLAEMFRLRTMEHGLQFNCVIAENVPETVWADEERLRQVLINLLTNALNHTRRGSVSLHVTYRSQVCEFRIGDTGQGIAAADLDRIFEPFVSLAARNSGGPRGTGLGLTITRLMTEIMGGDIGVHSVPGKGSTFTVRLMLSSIDTSGENLPPAQRVVAYRGQRHRLVIVDDDADHRELMRQSLARLGFESLAHETAEACLDDPEAIGADGYLLDISLPGMNGWQLVERLKARQCTSPPIFMISAHADEWRHARAHQVEAQDILTKPIRFDRLYKRLQQRLNISWVTRVIAPAHQTEGCFDTTQLPDANALNDLRELVEIGHVRALHERLDELVATGSQTEPFTTHVRSLLHKYALQEVNRLLTELNPPESKQDRYSLTELNTTDSPPDTSES